METQVDNDQVDDVGTGGFAPPYTSFRTVLNLIERMGEEGALPARIDRSYLSNLPGSTQTVLISGLKSLGLIDEQAHPQPNLVQMVESPDERSLLINGLLRQHYGRVTDLAPNATQQQLEETFREYGVTGSTLRKAIAFFIAAARFADLPLSPHFRTPKAPTAETRPRKPREQGRNQSRNGRHDPPPSGPDEREFTRNLPTLVRGLIERLPNDGETWTAAEAQRWLEIADLTFPFVYRFRPEEDEKEGGDDD